MSVFLVVASLGLIMENNNFLAPVFPLAGSSYLGTFDRRVAYSYLIIVSNKEYLIQFDGIALVSADAVDIDDLSRSYLVLFTAGFNYRVNF